MTKIDIGRKALPILFIFFAIVGVLALSGNLPLSISGGVIQMEYDSKTGATNPVFYRELNFESGTEKTFWLTTVKDFSTGGKDFSIQSSKILEFNIRTKGLTCGYSSSYYDLAKLEGQYLSFHIAKLADYWGVKTYELGAPKRELKSTITINKWNEAQTQKQVVSSQTIDLMNLEPFYWQTKDIDDKGFVELKGLGALQGARDCPQTPMLLYYFNGKYYVGEKSKVLTALDQYFVCKIQQTTQPWLSCKTYENALANPYVPTSFSQSFISYTPSASGLTGTLSSNVIGKMELRADANFFDMIIIEKKLYPSPTIVECTFGDLQENVQGTGSVRVRNSGSTGTIYMYIETDASKLGTSYQPSQNIKSGAEYIWAVALYPKSKAEGIVIKATACDETKRYCSSCEKTIEIKEKPSFIDDLFGWSGSSCGNGICETFLGETYLTCQNDCKQPQEQKECPNYSYRAENGECLCIEGYKWTTKGTCEEMNIIDYLQLFLKQWFDAIGLTITVSATCCLSSLILVGIIGLYMLFGKPKIIRKIRRG